MKAHHILTALILMLAPASAEPAPKVQPAISGLIDQFKTYPLVGLGDYHGLAQELDFYAALVRDPRFAEEVGNLVMEFGAVSQPIIDRYLSGEDVPYTELRKVWTSASALLPAGSLRTQGLPLKSVFSAVECCPG